MRALPRPPSRAPAVLLVAVAAANGLVLAGGAVPSWIVLSAALVICCLAPGYLLSRLLLPGDAADGPLERSLAAVGCGYGVWIVAGMLAVYVAGALNAAAVAATFDVVILALLLAALATGLARRRGRDGAAAGDPAAAIGGAAAANGVAPLRRGGALGWAGAHGTLLAVLAVVAVGAALRLPNLGYAEVQGDEATILLKAAAAVQGRDDVLFVHKKGPAEIVIPATVYALAGRIDETSARLPFALATLAGLVAVFQLGRAAFSTRVGLVAALLLAVNGFYVGFGRIVQYQGVVFLMSALAMLAAWRLFEGRRPAGRLALCAALAVAVGLLAHYDAALVLPAIGFLVVRRWVAEPSVRRGDLRWMAGSALAAAAILAAFYVPMVRHPYFGESTWRYLFEQRMGGDAEGLFTNTLPNAAALSMYYGPAAYMALLTAALLLGMALRLSRQPPTGPPVHERVRLALAVALPLALALGGALLLADPDRGRVGASDWGAAWMLAAVAVVLVWRGPTPAWKAVLLWAATGLVLYTAVVRSPRTHFHVAFAPWCLLAAVALDDLGARLRPAARLAGAAAVGAVWAATVAYAWLMFVQHGVEYRRQVPPALPPGFAAAPFELPSNGWFGYPYRAGWKAIGALYGRGELRGTYWSNEEPNVTGWYTRGAPRCDREPRYLFLAQGVQDPRPVPEDPAAVGYAHVATVTTEGRRRIEVWQRGAPAGEPVLRAVEDEARAFDRATGRAFDAGLPLAGDAGALEPPLAAELGGRAELIGYGLHPSEPRPGDEVSVTLYWRALAAMERDYSVFAHLYDARAPDRVLAQSDGAPGVCGEPVPTTTWEPGRVYVDRRVVVLPADAPPGPYGVRVGLYDYETLERLPVTAGPEASSAAPAPPSAPDAPRPACTRAWSRGRNCPVTLHPDHVAIGVPVTAASRTASRR